MGQIVAVERFDVDAEGAWPCGACGSTYPVGESWRVTRAQSSLQIVCPDCANEALLTLAEET